MSPKKSKRKKNKQRSAHKHPVGGDKLSDKPEPVRMDGKIEATIHPDLVKKHDAGQDKQDSRADTKLKIEIATLVIVFIYTAVAAWQACTNYDVAQTSQRQLELDQRPWVGLMGSNHIAAEMVKGSPIKVRVDFQNVGKTPALDESGVSHLSNHPISTPMPDFDNCSRNEASAPVTLMPNAITNVTIATDAPGSAGVAVLLTDADLALINTEKVQLFVHGCIWYKDTFGKDHRTNYCLQYIPATRGGGSANSFAACAVHNYAD